MVWSQFVLIGLAAMAAVFVNALAGSGTLISFPTLVAAGIPAVAAIVTNTVALGPGYLGATIAQFKDLKGQRQRLWLYLPAGVIGSLLLLNSGGKIVSLPGALFDPAGLSASGSFGHAARLVITPPE